MSPLVFLTTFFNHNSDHLSFPETRRRVGMIVVSIITFLLLMQWADACPSQCQCYQGTVNCSSLNLTEVPNDIPSNTTHLYLSHNRISSLGSNVLGQILDLELLDLSYNSMTNIDDLNTRDMQYLKVLLLDNNQLNFSVEDLFFLSFGLNSLQRLSISHNLLSGAVEKNTFTYFSALKHLDLSHNPITAIKSSAFYIPLESLNVSYTLISEISTRAFRNLRTLQRLDLRGSQMTKMTKVYFYGLSRLTELKLGGERLTFLSSYLLSGLSALTSLVITGTKIVTVYASFLKPCPKLQLLDMSNNSLASIPSSVFSNNDDIETVILDNNLFSTVPYTPSSVVMLSVRSNRVLKLPAVLPPELEILDLSNNSITNLTTLSQSESLKTLNLSENPLQFLASDSLSNLTALTLLVLTPSNITEAASLSASNTSVVLSGKGVTCDCEGALRYDWLPSSWQVQVVSLSCGDGSGIDDVAAYALANCSSSANGINGTTVAIIVVIVLVVLGLLAIAAVICARTGGARKFKRMIQRRNKDINSPTRCPTISAEVNVYCEAGSMPRSTQGQPENAYGTVDELPGHYVMADDPVSRTETDAGCDEYAAADDNVAPKPSTAGARKQSSLYDNAHGYENPLSTTKPDYLDIDYEHHYHMPSSPSSPYVLPDTTPYPDLRSAPATDANPYLTPISSVDSYPAAFSGYMDFGNAQDAKTYEVVL